MLNLAALVKTPKLVTGMRAKSGFTLIEILVVLLILGTAITFAMLSFGDFGKSRVAKSSAEQFVQYIQLMQQKAILENRVLGITIKPDSYQAMKYISSQGWRKIYGGNVYRKQPIPNGLRLYNKNTSNSPVDIIIQSSGDITPFKVSIGDKQKHMTVLVTGFANGEVRINAHS